MDKRKGGQWEMMLERQEREWDLEQWKSENSFKQGEKAIHISLCLVPMVWPCHGDLSSRTRDQTHLASPCNLDHQTVREVPHFVFHVTH